MSGQFKKMETDKQTQTVQATLESPCPRFAKTSCQRSQWCHDKVRLQKARIHDLQENAVVHTPQNNGVSRQEQVVSAKLDRAISPSLREARALRSRSSQFRSHCLRHTAKASMHVRPWFLNLLPARLHLRCLEILQAPARLRCWLLRNCVIPLTASRDNHSTESNLS